MSRGNTTVVFTLCHSFVNGKRWVLLKFKILPKDCAYVVHIQMPKVMMENSVPLRTLLMSCSRHGNATPIVIYFPKAVSWWSIQELEVNAFYQCHQYSRLSTIRSWYSEFVVIALKMNHYSSKRTLKLWSVGISVEHSKISVIKYLLTSYMFVL